MLLTHIPAALPALWDLQPRRERSNTAGALIMEDREGIEPIQIAGLKSRCQHQSGRPIHSGWDGEC